MKLPDQQAPQGPHKSIEEVYREELERLKQSLREHGLSLDNIEKMNKDQTLELDEVLKNWAINLKRNHRSDLGFEFKEEYTRRIDSKLDQFKEFETRELKERIRQAGGPLGLVSQVLGKPMEVILAEAGRSPQFSIYCWTLINEYAMKEGKNKELAHTTFEMVLGFGLEDLEADIRRKLAEHQ